MQIFATNGTKCDVGTAGKRLTLMVLAAHLFGETPLHTVSPVGTC